MAKRVMYLKKKGDIPLAAIPARPELGKGKSYPLDYRQKTVELMRSMSPPDVAAKTGVTLSVLYTWRKALDPMFELREELDGAARARTARLEQCAFVLEREGPDGERVAAAVRAIARGDSYVRVDVRPKEARKPRPPRP